MARRRADVETHSHCSLSNLAKVQPEERMLLVVAPISGRDQSLRPLDGESSDDEKEEEATTRGFSNSARMRAYLFHSWFLLH